MRIKPGGVSEFWGPLGVVEMYASTCAHCNKITDIPNMRKMHEHVDICRQCMKLICLDPACQTCTPFIKKIEAHEEREYRRKQGEML